MVRNFLVFSEFNLEYSSPRDVNTMKAGKSSAKEI